jgi:cytochrome P450
MTDIASPPTNPLLNEYWLQSASVIDAHLDELRSQPMQFFPEPQIPEGSPFPQGAGAWAVVNHADVVYMSKNPKLFSSAKGVVTGDMPQEIVEFFGSMIAMDDPRHVRLRRIVAAGFTPKMLQRLEDSVQLVARDIVDDIGERGQVDFVVDVAARLPLKIVCDLMGIPESEYQFVFDRTNVILGLDDPEYVDGEIDEVLGTLITAATELVGLMNEVAASKAGGDGSDLTSVLTNATVEEDELTPEDIASFFILLVAAGNETTRNAISWALKLLSDNPDQRAVWAADFDAIAPTAVEEIVRLASPVTYMRRTATEDLVLGGQAISEGDKLNMYYLAANRDPSVFTDPYRFDVRRNPNPQLGYGGPGPHFCLGAHLARREITVMYRELFSRLPDIVATSDPVLLNSGFIHGVKHMTAEFSPIARALG